MKLYFDRNDVTRLLDHAMAAQEHSPTFDQMLDPTMLKKDAPRRGFPEPDDIDRSKVPAGLQLVGDEGVYLLSNGFPALMQNETKQVAIYAKGADPEKDRDSFRTVKRASFGGDDGVEFIPAETIRAALEATVGEKFWISVTPTKISTPKLAPPKSAGTPARKKPKVPAQ